ncbi:MAG TPA: MFS transporter [Solimonas sp.]|nr:MFS transporter [Solimonas sp.]
MNTDLPAKRLAGFYFFYYATVGAFMPYWSPYLEARGFSATQMGIAYALMGVSRMFTPVVWGWLADRTQRGIVLVRWSSFAALVVFLAIPFAPSLLAIGALMLAYTLFWHALLPQFEAVALAHLVARGADYSRVRLWGSVGFVVSVLALGPVLDRVGILPLPWLVAVAWVGMALSSWTVPSPPPMVRAADEPAVSLWSLVRKPEVVALLVACLASQLSFAPYYNFFTLFLERHGYTRGFAGMLWALAVIAEIGLFVVMGRLMGRFGARNLMLAALAMTSVRWALTALAVESLPTLLLLQLSHALTFGAYHAVAVHYVQRLFPPAAQGRGQALYNAVAYGVGGSIGSLSAGFVWEKVSPEAVFLGASLVAALGFWVALKRLPAA